METNGTMVNQYLTNRKNPRFCRNVNLPVINEPHLVAAGEHAEAGQDGLVLVDHKAREPYALAASAVGGENGVDVARKNESGCVEFYFWVVCKNEYIFLVIIHIHLQVAFEKEADGQNVVVAHHDDHFDVMVLGAPFAEGFPF